MNCNFVSLLGSSKLYWQVKLYYPRVSSLIDGLSKEGIKIVVVHLSSKLYYCEREIAPTSRPFSAIFTHFCVLFFFLRNSFSRCFHSLFSHTIAFTRFSFFQILVNNKPADFPANTKNLHAFLVTSAPNIKSDYGVRVLCTHKHSVMLCMVHVSGFYHGKLRGLLGDGNNEHYDDYTLPSGKVSVACFIVK